MNTSAEIENAVLLALLEAKPGRMTWPMIASEVALRGSATGLWEEFYPSTLQGLDDHDGLIAGAAERLCEWSKAGLTLVTVLDRRYPTALRGIHQLPPFLFVEGCLVPDDRGVSIVGSRDASERGVTIATNLARGLVDRGITVISGLAGGIDAAAHTETLRCGGRPLGVIGTGITKSYPAKNRPLQAAVARAGAVVSQFWPDAPPRKQSFPMRNATMSGLGRASIVVEAGEHSGARIQARLAVEHGRPVILTDLVVRSTEWGKALVGRPGVYECGGIAEAMEVVEHVAPPAQVGAGWEGLPKLAFQ